MKRRRTLVPTLGPATPSPGRRATSVFWGGRSYVTSSPLTLVAQIYSQTQSSWEPSLRHAGFSRAWVPRELTARWVHENDMFSGATLGGRGAGTVCTQRGSRLLAFCPRSHVLRGAVSFPAQPHVQIHPNRLCLQTLFQRLVSIHALNTFTPVYSNNRYEQQFPGPSFGGGSPSGSPEFISGVRGVAVMLDTVTRGACQKVTPSGPDAPRAIPTEAPNPQATPAASSSSFWKPAFSRGSAMR